MHITEDDLVLHYYGELPGTDDQRTASHLAVCQQCREEFTRLQRVLGALDESTLVPDLPEGFERTTWARLEPNLSAPTRWFTRGMFAPVPLALAAAVIVLVGAAFFAGRMSSPSGGSPVIASPPIEQVRERILLIDLGEHLDRSQMVLVELVSAGTADAIDISAERTRAQELLAANRLYRQTAISSGDRTVTELLDELERVLIEVAAGSGRSSADDLQNVRRQIDAQSLLFKVRVVSSEVRERQREAIQRQIQRRRT